MSRNQRARMLIAIVTLVLLLITLFPVIWIVFTSFKNRNDIFAWPPVLFFRPTFSSYVKFLSPGSQSIIRHLANSLLIALGTVLITLLCAGLAAYSFSRFRFHGRRTLLYTILATRLLPPVTSLIPLFISFNSLGMIDTQLGLVIIYTALNIPFAVWMLKAYFDGIPVELEQSAEIDGCSRMQALWYILLPLAAPGLVAVAIFIFRISWNEFMFAFIFTSTNARTMPVRIAETVGELQIYWTDMAALTVILMIPAVIFTFFMQQNLVKGLTAGALK